MFLNACQMLEKEVGNAFPSACLAVGLKDEILLQKSFGAATLDTYFDIASMSKITSTTMIALKYIETGKIRLYDRLDYFYNNVDKDKANITILNLMTHTSGLPAHVYMSEYAKTKDDVESAILKLELVNAVGKVPVYSCIGYILLGKILEEIGKKPLDELAKELVFEPLGLKHTTYRPTGDIAPTELYPPTGELLCGIVHDENARFLDGISGNAGVFSTIGDMAKFTQMLALGGTAAGGNNYLSSATMKAAILNRTPGENHEYRGLGFNLARSPANFMGDLLGEHSYGHTGFTGTSMAVDPASGLFIVLLTNRVCPTRDNIKLVRLRSLLHNTIAAEASVKFNLQ